MAGLVIDPLVAPLDATVTLPGSKSLTNRALVAAALAHGRSRLTGVLFADDTEAMLDCLVRLRVGLVPDPRAATVEVVGTGGVVPDGSYELDARLSGTTSRFLLPVLALGAGDYRMDGAESLRQRPMGPLLDALRALGARVEQHGSPGHLPVTLSGGPPAGGAVALAGDVSSQFLSGLLLAAPAMVDGLRVALTTALVSRPYVDMTGGVMADFGVDLRNDDGVFVVAPTPYRAADVAIEPDASTASYFFAAAAICGGRVQVEGLGTGSRQGDVAFVDLLEQMGADVERTADAITVTGTGDLDGGVFDCSAISDTAQTLAVVAVFATGPSRITGIGFIRSKETDRIAAVVTELRRCGIDAEEEADGFVVHPGRPGPTEVRTYHDHRMAMSFALLGLRVPGIVIRDPGCVAKTFPRFFAVLGELGTPDKVRRR